MRTNTGAIQISRSIFDSDIWHKPPEWLKIWLFILGNVNFKDSNDFKRGENFFRYEVIAVECKCSINTVNKCIKFLKEAGQIQNRKTTRGAIITVNKYNIYQDLSNYGRIEAVQKQNRSSTGTNTIIEEGKEYTEELEKLLNFWNITYNLKNRITDNLETIYFKARKKFSKDEIKLGVNNYKNYIQKNDWVKHRFSLYDFLKQSNGLEKFINQ